MKKGKSKITIKRKFPIDECEQINRRIDALCMRITKLEVQTSCQETLIGLEGDRISIHTTEIYKELAKLKNKKWWRFWV